MVKVASTFKPYSYQIFNVIVMGDESEISDINSVKLMRLHKQKYDDANFEIGRMYRVTRNGVQLEVERTTEDYEIHEDWLVDAFNCEDYLTKNTEQQEDAQFSYIMNSLRNTIK